MPNQKFPGPRDGIRYIYLSLSPCSEVRQFLNLRSSVEWGMIVLPEPSWGRVQRMPGGGGVADSDGDEGRQCTCSISMRSRLLDDG